MEGIIIESFCLLFHYSDATEYHLLSLDFAGTYRIPFLVAVFVTLGGAITNTVPDHQPVRHWQF